MRKLLIPIMMMLWFRPASSAGQGSAPDLPQALVTQIASDLAIVTEISIGAPYLGQQFSILYRLRAQRPPAAVDIDPQQYSGFWSEVVAIPADSASLARPVKGQNAVEYMLRQVIAYPLLEGRQELPRLSVKIKRAGARAGPNEDWDVVGASASIAIEVIPLPPGPPAASGGIPFVGGIQGALRASEEGAQEWVLEIQGTANLAFFKPLDWLKAPPGLQLRASLDGTDPLSQTVEIEGRRQFSLLQRQRWRIAVSGIGKGQRLDGFYLPVFDPFIKTWQSQHISGLVLPEREGGGDPAGEVNRPGAPSRKAGSPWTAFRGALILGLAGVTTAIAWIFWRRGRGRETRLGSAGNIPLLEKKLRTSPRAFIDGAHKVLHRYALDQQRSHSLGAGETDLDQCWISIQKYRFSQEPVPVEACEAILESIKRIL